MAAVSSELPWKGPSAPDDLKSDRKPALSPPESGTLRQTPVLRPGDLRKIGAIGFQKWYDKKMLEARLCLFVAFGCLIFLMVGFEVLLAYNQAANLALKVLIVTLGGMVAYLAFYQYRDAMELGASVGTIANCPQCKYPSFSVVKRESRRVSKDFGARLRHDLNAEGLLVRCRACNHKWRWGGGA